MTSSVIKVTNKQTYITAADKIFDKPFYVEMETFNTLGEENLEVRGEFTTGDRKVDQQMSKRPSRVWRTINELLELWHDGVDITVVKGLTDIEIIHTIIQEHLSDCSVYHGKMVNSMRRERPEVMTERLNDLRRLDEFGKFLYNRVRTSAKAVKITGIDKIMADTGDAVGAGAYDDSVASIRNSPDYVGIEERIDYTALRKRKRYT